MSTIEPRKLEVSVLGPPGTYTHEAAFKYFGTEANYHDEKTIADVSKAIVSNDFGVIPQENTIFGGVVETYDVLRRSDAAYVCGEVILAVQHCLLVRKGVKLEQIKRVMSHEQALGQCGHFLKEHLPNAVLVKTTSTASAAQTVLASEPTSATIGSKICATVFDGLEILFEGIQNERSNFTRFYIIRKPGSPALMKSPDATNRALLRIMNLSVISRGVFTVIGEQGLSITRVDRRPELNSEPFQDVYFFELEGTSQIQDLPEKLQVVIERIESAGGKAELAGLW